MAVYRVERDKDYTVKGSHHLRNKELCIYCATVKQYLDNLKA